jgi:hypothetical protein
MKKVNQILISLAILLAFLVSFSACTEDNKDDSDGMQKFRQQLIGKWKYYAYYYDGDWIEVKDGDYGHDNYHGNNTFATFFQFNSNGTFSPVYSSWEITGQGTTWIPANDTYSYYVKLKDNSGKEEDFTLELIFSYKPSDFEMEYDYPNILKVYIGYRSYMYVRN